MFGNYIKVAFRNLLKHRAYSFINVFGLAVGMASAVLILLFVRYEKSYDRFHENADRIHRIAVRAMTPRSARPSLPPSSRRHCSSITPRWNAPSDFRTHSTA